MKLIEPNVKEIKDFEGVDNFYKATARAARICYASDKTDNDKELCERLIKLGHYSPFEHAIIYLDFYKAFYNSIFDIFTDYVLDFIRKNKYTIYLEKGNIVAVNGRIFIEGIKDFEKTNNLECYNIEEIFEQLDDTIVDTHKLKSFIVDTNIGCTRELNRHDKDFYYTDPLDLCEQSTRYCNFSLEKFGKEITFNKPYWYDTASVKKQNAWEFAMRQAEFNYIDNLKDFTIDEIRGVLPLDTHTRAIYTSTVEEWQHIIDLRLKGTTGKPHGDIKIIAEKIDKLINR